MNTIAEFVTRNSMKMSIQEVDTTPLQQSLPPSHRWGARHWKCILCMGEKQMVVYFSGGELVEEPSLEEVLNAMADDASLYESISEPESEKGFLEFCSDCGYDPDSRAAERTYRELARQTKRLRKFLGDGPYGELLWETERL